MYKEGQYETLTVTVYYCVGLGYINYGISCDIKKHFDKIVLLDF